MNSITENNLLHNYRRYIIIVVLIFSTAGLLLDLFQEWGFMELYVIHFSNNNSITGGSVSEISRNVNLVIINAITITVYIFLFFLLLKRRINVMNATVIYSLILSANIYIAYFWYFLNMENISNYILRDLIIFYIIVFVASTCTSTTFTILISFIASAFYIFFAILSDEMFLIKNMPVFVMLVGSFAFVSRKIIIILDRSIIKQEQEAIRIKELNAFKEKLTKMLLHDVKVPLTSIISLSDSTPTVSNLKKINYQAIKTVRMLSNIIDVESENRIKIKLKSSLFSVYELINESIEQIYYHALEKNISVKHNTTDKKMLYYGDKELLERTIINIIENAIKYSGENSIIDINAYHQNENLIMLIADQGKGIKPKEMNKIFELFYTSEMKSGNDQSSGIGLTFCKFAIEAHGGEIIVKSDSNKGSIFIITLPLTVELKKESIIEDKKMICSVSEDTRVRIKPLVKKLKKLYYYQTSDILNVLNSIGKINDGKFTEEFDRIKEVALSCNEEKYNELLKILT